MEYYPPGGALSSGPLSATDSDSWCKPPVTGGTSTALTVTDTRIGTPADHQTFRFKMNQDCGTAPYLAVNGGTSLQLCYKPAGSYLNFNSGELPNGAIITARYLSAYGLYVVEEWIDVFGGIKRFPSRLATSDMPAAKAFIAHKAASQTISWAATTRLTWDAASRNDSLFTVSGTGNITMTAVLTGVYAVCADIYASGTFELEIWVNGSRYHSGPVVSSSAFINSIVPLAAGDTIEIYLYAQSGAISPDASCAYLSNLRIARIN